MEDFVVVYFPGRNEFVHQRNSVIRLLLCDLPSGLPLVFGS